MLLIVSELFLTLFKRAKSTIAQDRGSLRLIWGVNVITFALGIYVAYHLPACRFHWPIVFEIGYGMFAAGLILRWYAIIYLGTASLPRTSP